MIIFIYGPDDFRGHRKIKELENKFIREVDQNGTSLSVLDGAETDIKKIHEKIGSSSLFSRKRMVVIKNIFLAKNKDSLKEITDYFKNNKWDKENIVVFWSPEIKKTKKGKKEEILLLEKSGKEKKLPATAKPLFTFLSGQEYVQEFKELSNTETVKWVKNEMEQRGGNITRDVSQHLVGIAGNNLWQLNNEINKLLHYKKSQDNKVIGIKDIEDLVKGSFDENIFALTDCLSNKNKTQAIKLLEEQYQSGLTDFYLLSMIMWQFRVLLRIREALDSGFGSKKIISQLKLHPFVVQKGINQVRRFDSNYLKKFLNRLLEIDYLVKSGQGDAKTMLSTLIVKM